MGDQKSFRQIASLRVGDRVASRNEVTGHYGTNLITALPGSFHEDKVTLQLEDGHGKLETIVTTLEHPFYIKGRGFVDAGDMKAGMKVSQWQSRAPPLVQNVGYSKADSTGSLLSRWLSQIGDWVTSDRFKPTPAQAAPHTITKSTLLVKSIKIIRSGLKPWRAYNLTVANDHTYFVGKQKAWVHNIDCSGTSLLGNGGRQLDDNTIIGIYGNRFTKNPDGTTYSLQGQATQAEISAVGITPQPFPRRPTHQESEIDVARDFPGWDQQRSWRNTEDAIYGEKGSVRPDLSNTDTRIQLDVKNYDLTSNGNRSSLYNTIKNQAASRAVNLPENSHQVIVLDIRGQIVDSAVLGRIPGNIQTATGGIIPSSSVVFRTSNGYIFPK